MSFKLPLLEVLYFTSTMLYPQVSQMQGKKDEEKDY